MAIPCRLDSFSSATQQPGQASERFGLTSSELDSYSEKTPEIALINEHIVTRLSSIECFIKTPPYVNRKDLKEELLNFFKIWLGTGFLYKTNQEIQFSISLYKSFSYFSHVENNSGLHHHGLQSVFFYSSEQEFMKHVKEAATAVYKAVNYISALGKLILGYIHPNSPFGVFSQNALLPEETNGSLTIEVFHV